MPVVSWRRAERRRRRGVCWQGGYCSSSAGKLEGQPESAAARGAHGSAEADDQAASLLPHNGASQRPPTPPPKPGQSLIGSAAEWSETQSAANNAHTRERRCSQHTTSVALHGGGGRRLG